MITKKDRKGGFSLHTKYIALSLEVLKIPSAFRTEIIDILFMSYKQ